MAAGRPACALERRWRWSGAWSGFFIRAGVCLADRIGRGNGAGAGLLAVSPSGDGRGVLGRLAGALLPFLEAAWLVLWVVKLVRVMVRQALEGRGSGESLCTTDV